MPASSAPTPATLHAVLADLEYPAERWRVIAEAQYYGATTDWVTALFRLPSRTYRGFGDVANELFSRLQPTATHDRRLDQAA